MTITKFDNNETMKKTAFILSTVLSLATISSQAFALPLQPKPAYSADMSQRLLVPVSSKSKNSLTEKELNNAKSYIASLTKNAISFLSNEKLSQAQKNKKFEALLNDRFDMRSIGRFAIGRHWRSLKPKEQDQYLDLFKTMILDVYTRRFSDYQGQAIDVVSARAEGRRDILVASVIKQEEGPDIQLDWRLRPNKKTGKLKVIDVIVEGVSMALTQRSEFASVIQRGGGKANILIAHLKTDK